MKLHPGQHLGKLGLVHFQVTPDDGENHLPLRGAVEDSLQGLAGLDAEQLGQVFDGGGVGRGDLFQGQCLPLEPLSLDELGLFGVRGRFAGRADDQSILADRADRHEFVRGGASHDAGIGLHRQRLHAAARKDIQVSLIDARVIGVQALHVGVKAVAIFHDELAHAHQAPTGTRLVAELGLNLIDHQGELAVGIDLLACQSRHALLMRHGKHHVVPGAILEAQERRPGRGRIVTARGAPDIGRLHHPACSILAHRPHSSLRA